MAQDEASLQNVPLAQDAAASGLELRSAKNRAATANAPAEGELSGLNTQLGLGTVKKFARTSAENAGNEEPAGKMLPR